MIQKSAFLKFPKGLVNEPVSFCWNELLTKDIDTAMAFYTALFGWEINAVEDAPVEYYGIMNADRINGGIIPWIEQLTSFQVRAFPFFLEFRRGSNQYLEFFRIIRIPFAIKIESADCVFNICHLGLCYVSLGLAEALKYPRCYYCGNQRNN